MAALVGPVSSLTELDIAQDPAALALPVIRVSPKLRVLRASVATPEVLAACVGWRS